MRTKRESGIGSRESGAPRRASIPLRDSTGSARRRRGASEIELLLGLTVLIGLILLLSGGLKLGRAMLATSRDAEYRVIRDATELSPPQYASAETPVAELSSDQAGLPNRIHTATSSATVSVYAGDRTLPPVTISRAAQTLSPAWTENATPATGDQNAMATWFSTFADAQRGAYIGPLGLSPSWPP